MGKRKRNYLYARDKLKKKKTGVQEPEQPNEKQVFVRSERERSEDKRFG